MEVSDIGAHVHLDDVALFEDATAGDAVDNFVVYGDTGAGGKTAVAEEGRTGTAFFNVVSDLIVQLLGCDTGPYHFPGESESLAGDTSRNSHFCNLFGCFYRNHLAI